MTGPIAELPCQAGAGRGGRCALFALALAISIGPGSASLAAEALSDRVASYRIEARLDPDARTVRARQTLTWKNDTRQTAGDLWLHLYLNAFANNRTTFLRDEAMEEWAARYPDEWGGIDIEAIRIGGDDVTKTLEIVRPDDDNPDDATVARLPLARPVRPGHDVEVEFEFVARLPRLWARSGHVAPFFFVGQWFPKVGVFRDGKWSCHQYYPTTEFFADFGRYDVSLTVPADYVVGHTGVAVAERRNEDGTKTIDVVAEDVHDFAWVADPRFRVTEESIAGIPVRLLMQPHHAHQTQRHLRALRAAIERYAAWFGPYPYPALTVVDPAPGASAAGGMEYPMLITGETRWWIPQGMRLPELVMVHEFGHQYWYAVVANDEVREAWLDEGLNSFVEGLIMDEAYGPRASYLDLLGLGVDAVALQRYRYLRAPSSDPIDTPAHQVLDTPSYVSTAYAKTALALYTLQRTLGGDRLLVALRDYFETWRFRHPSGADFRRALEKSTGEDLEDFFRQTFDGSGVLDYAVSRLDVRREPGLFGRKIRALPDTRPALRYRVEVIVERRGEVRLPVDILVVFDDGSEVRQTWDGQGRWHRIDMASTEKASYAVVDPDMKLPLDVERLNNSRMRSGGRRGIVRLAGRWGLWMQALLHALTGF
jgi:Peptidase family M1 domain